MKKEKKRINKLYDDISSYHDIVSDLRDIWGDLNGILDMQDKRENDVLVGFEDVINNLEGCVRDAMNKIDELKENK